MDAEMVKTLLDRHPSTLAGIATVNGDVLAVVIDCGDGWFWILDALLEALEASRSADSPDDHLSLRVVRIKKKLGSLRVQAFHASPEQMGMIRFAERLSRKVCELCGAAMPLACDDVRTRCATCELELRVKPRSDAAASHSSDQF